MEMTPVTGKATRSKVLRLLLSENPSYRLLLAANKSPLRHIIKRTMTLTHLKQKRKRRTAARALGFSPGLEQPLTELKEKGYVRLGCLSDSSLTELQSASLSKQKGADKIEQTISTKSFWLGLLDDEIKQKRLTDQSIFVRFALQLPILQLVSRYFGELPYLSYVFLSQSKRTDQPLAVSQLWHKDKDDTRVLKLFTYLSDVNSSEDGPFTFLPKGISQQVRNSFFARHLRDDEVFNNIPLTSQVQILGPQGTTFIVDTGHCYHMGSRMMSSNARLMYTAAFQTVPSIYPNSRNHIAISSPLPETLGLVLRPN